MSIGKLKKTEAAEIEALRGAFEAARDALRAKLEEIRDGWQADYDEKSERWQEGDNGTTASEGSS